VRIEPQVLAHREAQTIDVVTVPVEVLAKLADVAATVAGRDGKPQALLGEKLTLSLDEAAELAGLSRGHLRAAVGDGSLQAKKIGRGWRVKRADLENYVEKL
jgi:excisionase family DNA binding protein